MPVILQQADAMTAPYPGQPYTEGGSEGLAKADTSQAYCMCTDQHTKAVISRARAVGLHLQKSLRAAPAQWRSSASASLRPYDTEASSPGFSACDVTISKPALLND